THLAIAIAYRAIQNGFDAIFTTAAALIDDLSRASRDGRMREALTTYTHPHVLVCDEVGYLSYGADAANVLFHVVTERHLKKRAMIFTNNKSLDAWGHVLHDQDLADAIVDRILERGRLLTLDGPSMRTRHLDLDDRSSSKAKNLSSSSTRANARDVDEHRGAGGGAPGEADQLARFSGTKRADFPEPTPLPVRLGSKDLIIDLGAERVLAAEKEGRKIAVEVKSFVGTSEVTDLHLAIGQYVVYGKALAANEPDRTLYLAVRLQVYRDVFQDPLGQLLLNDGSVR